MRRVGTVGGGTLWAHSERYYVRVEDAQRFMLDSLADEIIAAAMRDSIEQDELTQDGDCDETGDS